MLLLACTTMCAACRPTWHARDVLIFAGDRKQQEQTYTSEGAHCNCFENNSMVRQTDMSLIKAAEYVDLNVRA